MLRRVLRRVVGACMALLPWRCSHGAAPVGRILPDAHAPRTRQDAARRAAKDAEAAKRKAEKEAQAGRCPGAAQG